jgi:flagellar basal-body rod modification protein FlgD
MATTAPVGSTTTSTSAATATASDPTTASAQSTVDDAQNRFLTLLVSQLQNQDPLNPLDNAQITTQLAQLSTVTGINKLNDTLTAMSAAADAKQYLQSAALVGHNVVVAGNALTLNNGAATGAFNLSADADDVTITIKDADGNAVRTIDLGARKSGVGTFAWDGRNDSGKDATDGTYTISVTATAKTQPVSVDPLAVSRVSGVVPGAGGGQLQVDNIGMVDLSQVLQIN